MKHADSYAVAQAIQTLTESVQGNPKIRKIVNELKGEDITKAAVQYEDYEPSIASQVTEDVPTTHSTDLRTVSTDLQPFNRPPSTFPAKLAGLHGPPPRAPLWRLSIVALDRGIKW